MNLDVITQPIGLQIRVVKIKIQRLIREELLSKHWLFGEIFPSLMDLSSGSKNYFMRLGYCGVHILYLSKFSLLYLADYFFDNCLILDNLVSL